MKYLSLFSGIGGFELGIKQAYVETINRKKDGRSKKVTKAWSCKGYSKSQSLDAEGRWDGEHNNSNSKSRQEQPTCVGYSEIDKYATQIYQSHFPEHKNYGDITKIKTEDLPEFDLIVGGFPCQSFSIAGKRGGFSDTRGTMFFEIARILKAKQPRLLLLENVKGLLSHDEGRTFATIISTLDELGYDLQWQVLNSKNFGVPQNRERVFIIGHLRGTPRPEVFPIKGQGNKNTTIGKSAKTAVARTLTGGGHTGGNHSGMTILQIKKINEGQLGRIYSDEGISPTLNTAETGGLQTPKILQRPRGKNKGGTHALAPTLTGKSYQDNNHLNGIRRLTPTECERLQGFPDGWTEGVSDTQRYKTLGNAVTVNVIREIMKKLLPYLEK